MYYKIINRKKKIITMLSDLAGYALWSPSRLFMKKASIPREKVREILIIRTAYIGDVVMTMPVLKPLKELYPESRITFLTAKAAADLFINNPYVDTVLAYDAFWFYKASGTGEYLDFVRKLRERTYDIVIDARADIRDILLLVYPAKARRRVSYGVGGGAFLLTDTVPFEGVKHKVEYHLDIARYLGGRVEKPLDWGIYLTAGERRKAEELLGRQKGLYVGMHPGGRKPLKCWAPERFACLADRVTEEFGGMVFFMGASGEAHLIDGIMRKMKRSAVNLAGKADLRTGAALMERLDLFVTNDSAPLHIASAMRTPTVAIFGPSKSLETGPYGNIHRVVEKDYPCRFTCDEDVCGYKNHNECMAAVTVDDVFAASEEVLRESRSRAKYGVQA